MTDAEKVREVLGEMFLGWWCQATFQGGGLLMQANMFHEDPVDGCPGPHVACYSSPAAALSRLEKCRAVVEAATYFAGQVGVRLPPATEAAWLDLRQALSALQEEER